MPGLMTQMKHEARATARSAVWVVAGALLGLFALALLTAALWMVVASAQGVLFATAVLGALYAVAAAFCLAVGLRRAGSGGNDDGPGDDFRRQPLVQIAEGFALGMQAGRAAHSDRS